jgi:hypothetical protein
MRTPKNMWRLGKTTYYDMDRFTAIEQWSEDFGWMEVAHTRNDKSRRIAKRIVGAMNFINGDLWELINNPKGGKPTIRTLG